MTQLHYYDDGTPTWEWWPNTLPLPGEEEAA